MGAISLLATATAIREGDVFPGTAPEGAPDLFLGTIATAFPPGDTWEPEKLTSKADAGAQFILLQVCHDLELLSAYMERLVASKLSWVTGASGGVRAWADRRRRCRAARGRTWWPRARTR